MNNENPNTKPDLDFILSRPDPNQPQKRHKKPRVYAGVLFIFVAIIGMAIFLSAVGKKADLSAGQNVADSFVSNLSGTDSKTMTNAMARVDPSIDTPAGIVNLSLIKLRASTDFKSCTRLTTEKLQSDSSKLQTNYSCKSITPASNISFGVLTQAVKGKQLVVGFEVANR